MDDKRLTYDPVDAAPLMGVSLPLVYQLCKRDDFPSFRVGRKILISADGLRRWIDRQAGGGGEK